RADGMARAQALRGVRLRLRAHRAQGAGLAMERRRAVRRVLRLPGHARALALHRHHSRGAPAHGGGVRPKTIYKICDATAWRAAEGAGEFAGAPVDRTDGYIHFSTAEQVADTAAKH